MTDTLNALQTSTQPASLPDVLLDAPPIEVPQRRTPVRKRLFDLAIAVPAAVLTLPVALGLGALSMVRYRQSPLFTQPRLGHGGKAFRFWKIRTLPRVAPEAADKYQLAALDLPKFARVVRYRHLDEFPQLWLVITGKMSLVGPRPEMPTLSASFDQGFVAERLTVKPGCTGLWQVSTSARHLIGEAPEFDLHYVRNWTLRLDMWIAYRTIARDDDPRPRSRASTKSRAGPAPQFDLTTDHSAPVVLRSGTVGAECGTAITINDCRSGRQRSTSCRSATLPMSSHEVNSAAACICATPTRSPWPRSEPTSPARCEPTRQTCPMARR